MAFYYDGPSSASKCPSRRNIINKTREGYNLETVLKRYGKYLLVAGVMAVLLLFFSKTIWATTPNPAEQTPLQLPVIESYAFLENLLKEYEQNEQKSRGYGAEDDISGAGGMAMSPEATAESAAVQDFSGTNTQVEGVDEADLVKTDGHYIYQVHGQKIMVVKTSAAGTMELSGSIDLSPYQLYPQELFVDSNYLVVLGRQFAYEKQAQAGFEEDRYPPSYYDEQKSKVLVYDITDRSRMVMIRDIEMAGSFLSARKIGPAVYVVSNQSIPLYRAAQAQIPLPYYKDSSMGAAAQTLSFDKMYYFPGCIYPSYINVAGFNLQENAKPLTVQSYLGNGENLYASSTNLYVALTERTVTDKSMMPMVETTAQEKTRLHRFSLNNGEIAYAATGEVPGRILNQFSMDEYQGYFRLATTTGDLWSRTEANISKNNLYVLDEETLQIAGRLEGIAPGEKIYSTRFMGERAYMVTFRKVDPFFVIDVQNPSQPAILGKLKIPGYSDYLHPYDDHHIIGFGKDTVEYKTEGSDSQAYYQGFKMALFDVSDVTNPREVGKEIIGARGTDSELLRNHKALLFSQEKNLLAFPITVLELKGNDQSPYSNFPEYGEFSYQGGYIYRVDAQQGFQFQGRVTHLSPEDYIKAGDYWYDSNKNITRMLYIGDNLFSLSNWGIKSYRLNDLTEIGTLPF